MRGKKSGEWIRSSPPPEILIFICPMHEAGYGGHLLSLFQKPLISAVVRPLLSVWTSPYLVPSSFSTAMVRKLAEGPPENTHAYRIWIPGHDTLGCPPKTPPSTPRRPFLLRFSFQVRSLNLAMGPLFRLPGRFDVGLTSRSASAVVNLNWRLNRISQQHIPTTRPAPKASANARGSKVEDVEKTSA